MSFLRNHERNQRQAHSHENDFAIADFSRSSGNHKFGEGVSRHRTSLDWTYSTPSHCSVAQGGLNEGARPHVVIAYRSHWHSSYRAASRDFCTLQVDRRFAWFGDSLEGIASAFFRHDPFLFVGNDFQ